MQDVAAKTIMIFWPHCRVGCQAVNRIRQLGAKRIGSKRAALKIPTECFTRLCLCHRQNNNVKGAHGEPRRALASAHDTARTRPARRSDRRRITSALHASETAAPSVPSRLSSSATTKAERSSVGWPGASSSRWPTRAFMPLAAARPAIGARLAQTLGITTQRTATTIHHVRTS